MKLKLNKVIPVKIKMMRKREAGRIMSAALTVCVCVSAVGLGGEEDEGELIDDFPRCWR